MNNKVQLNKYDLLEWVAKTIADCDLFGGCYSCMFECKEHDYKCNDKKRLKEELVKRYNL